LKAFLLAAGHGTRLRPLTNSIPKCLLPIQGTPLLEIWLGTCRRFDIDEVLINVCSHADAVEEFLARRDLTTPKVTVIRETELLGSAGTLRVNRGWVESELRFWVFYADVLNRVDLNAMLHLHRSRNPAATLGVYSVADPARCGVVEVSQDGTICDFVEKPQYPRSNLAFSGILIATTALLDAIPATQPADIGFHVLPRLSGRMLAYPIRDYLIDIGTMHNYRQAQLTWPGLEGERSHTHVTRNCV
jgi:mannose-1-phosphate guanylyltransferase